MIHFLNFDAANSKLSAIMRYPHPFIAIPQPKKVLTIHLGLFGRQISNKTFSYIIKEKGPLKMAISQNLPMSAKRIFNMMYRQM